LICGFQNKIVAAWVGLTTYSILDPPWAWIPNPNTAVVT